MILANLLIAAQHTAKWSAEAQGRIAFCMRNIALSCLQAYSCWNVRFSCFIAAKNKTLKLSNEEITCLLDSSFWSHPLFDSLHYITIISTLEWSSAHFLLLRCASYAPFLRARVTSTSKACIGWINPVPSTANTHTRSHSGTHKLDHHCQAPSLFNHSHSLQRLNY